MRLSRRATVGILLTGSSLSITGNFLATEALTARSSPAAASKKPAGHKPGADGAAEADGIRHFVNIKTNYGAVGDGVTDDSQAFADVSNDYQGQDLYLYLPPGEYRVLNPFLAANGEFLSGMSKLDIWGYGASWLANGFTGDSDSHLVWWGGGGEFAFEEIPGSDPYDVVKAYIQNTEVGDQDVTLVTPADADNFAVGDWVCVCAHLLEGGGFEPHNAHYFEFREIINIAGGVITFERGLTDGPYLTTNPVLGGDIRVPGMGPGMILKMKSHWNCELTVRGLSFPLADGPSDDGSTSMGANTRVMRFIDCDFRPGGATNGILPTTQVEMSFINCKFAKTVYYEVEIDKNVEELNYIGCDTNVLKFQSSTIKKLRIDNSTIRSLFGTPRTVYATNSRFESGLSLGPRGYGATLSATFDNCQMPAPGELESWAIGGSAQNFEFAKGTLARTDGDFVPWAIPGTICNISRNSSPGFRWPGPGFKVLRVYTNEFNHTLIDTTLTQQQWDDADGNNWRFIPHPCPFLEMRNCRLEQKDGVFYGTRDYHGAAGPVPLYSRVFRRYCTPAEISEAEITEEEPTIAPLHCRGNLVELKINVIKPYTGVETDLFFECSRSVGHNMNFSIDTKVAGERIITRDALRGFTANDSSDTPQQDFDGWFEDKLTVALSEVISAEAPGTWPVIEVSCICDQGIAGTGGIASPLPPSTVLEWTEAGDINPDDLIDVDILIINKAVGEATTVFLPAAVEREKRRSLKIVDGKLDASTFNITLNGDGGETIVGIGTYVINSNGGSVDLWPRPDGAGWYI